MLNKLSACFKVERSQSMPQPIVTNDPAEVARQASASADQEHELIWRKALVGTQLYYEAPTVDRLMEGRRRLSLDPSVDTSGTYFEKFAASMPRQPALRPAPLQPIASPTPSESSPSISRSSSGGWMPEQMSPEPSPRLQGSNKGP
jgi:hypothetical protein